MAYDLAVAAGAAYPASLAVECMSWGAEVISGCMLELECCQVNPHDRNRELGDRNSQKVKVAFGKVGRRPVVSLSLQWTAGRASHCSWDFQPLKKALRLSSASLMISAARLKLGARTE